MITEDGYCYRRHNVNDQTEYWSCRWKVKCYGRAITRNNRREFELTNEHDHLPDGLRREKIEFQKKIRLMASSDIDTTSIIQATLSTTSEVAKARLPKLASLRKYIERHRSKAHPPLLLPRTRNEINIQGEFQTTGQPNPEKFLMWDSGPAFDGNERILMFSTQKNIDFLRCCQGVSMNGTFETTPPLFEQLYTIYGTRLEGPGQRPGKAIPLIYFFLPDKTEATYMRAFAKLKTMLSGWESFKIMMGFESAAVRAVRKYWPNAQVTGCFFNLCRNIKKKIEELGLSRFYGESEENSIKFKMVAALAFVPLENVTESWEELLLIMQPWVVAQTEEIRHKIYDFLSFFELDYIGKNVEGMRCKPRVADVNMWNVRNVTLDGFRRTDDEVETFHKKISNIIQNHHVSLWKILKFLQNLQAETEKMMAESITGVIKPKRTENMRMAEKILNLVENWSSRSDFETYLRSLCLQLIY